MALTSASTLAEIKAQYFDNAAYEENASPSEAAAFITACRYLLLKLPKRIRDGGGYETELDPIIIQAELKAAQQWRRANVTSQRSVRYASFEGFRT